MPAAIDTQKHGTACNRETIKGGRKIVQKTVAKTKKPFSKRIEPLFYLLPAIVLLAVFVYFPFFKTVKDSFFLTDFMGNPKEFVGLENYTSLFENGKFLQSILNSLKFVVFTVPFSVGISFLLALIAGKKRKLSPIYETFFSLPMAMSMSVSAMIFQLMFNPTLGIVNHILNTDINWINDKRFAIWLLIIIQVWMNLGYNFLFLLSAVRGLPTELLECAELEGASGFQQSVKIILPLVSPTVFFLICNSLAKMMMMSGLTLVLTQGGPQGSTETMISFMYKAATESQNYNTAYPAAVIAFGITMVAMIITFIYEKKGVHY